MSNKTKREWLSPKEVEADYGLCISTLAKWRMAKKNIPFSKIGKAVKYKRSDIEAFLNASAIMLSGEVA